MDDLKFTNIVQKWAEESVFKDGDRIIAYEFDSLAKAIKAKDDVIAASRQSATFQLRGIKSSGKELLLRVSRVDPQGPVIKTLGRPAFVGQVRKDGSVVIG